MSAQRLLRVAVVGATGAVGTELLSLLESRRFPLQELLPIATYRSVGDSVELLGHEIPVATDVSRLHDLDLAFLCMPRAEALPWVRSALEGRVPCIDLSGAAAAAPEVPLLCADEPADPAILDQPVLGNPGGVALAFVRVLRPIHERAGLRRLVTTSLESVSAAGRAGVSALEAETVALFNQQEPPEPDVFGHGVAFDCLPATGAAESEGRTGAETALAADLARLLGSEVATALTALRVPTFAGWGASLALETGAPLAPAECSDLLAKTPGVRVWDEAELGPSTRGSVGGDDVLAGRIRADASVENGLLLWIAADPIRLAVSNALRLAEARFAQG